MKKGEFRNDVQVFLDGCQPAGDDPHWEYYETKKSQLSMLCGWDSGKEYYDQDLYEDAFEEMVTILKI